MNYAIIDLVAHQYTVMGLGTTPEAAMADAQHWAGPEWDWRGARCADVSAARAGRIDAGDNDASDLWDSVSEPCCDAMLRRAGNRPADRTSRNAPRKAVDGAPGDFDGEKPSMGEVAS